MEVLFFTYHARHRLLSREFQNRDILLIQAFTGAMIRISLGIFFLVSQKTLADRDIGMMVLYSISASIDFFNNVTFASLIGIIFASIVGSPLKDTIMKWRNRIHWLELFLWAWGTAGTLVLVITGTTYWLYLTLSVLGIGFCAPTLAMGIRIYYYNPPTAFNQSLDDFRTAQRRIFIFALGFQAFALVIVATCLFLWASPRHIYASGRYIQFTLWLACEGYGILGLYAMFWYQKDVSKTLKRMPSQMITRDTSITTSAKGTSDTDKSLSNSGFML